MKSIRTKITAMTMFIVVLTMTVATIFGVTAIRDIGTRSADRMLALLCETGQKNLNHYFDSVEQSVEMVSAYVQSDLKGIDDNELQAHLDRVSDIFKKLTYKTFGVLTYYYRISPEISKDVKGFWYVNLTGDKFEEHKVTDISQYDVNDTSKLVWFTVPRATGKGVWLPPYVTDNLDVRVISYNVPVYHEKRFIGVIGIEIDYSTMASEVKNISLYDNGYAFLINSKGGIAYHPRMDVANSVIKPATPAGLLSESEHVNYEFDGVEKQAAWLPLNNGMRICVSVPVREINAEWRKWSSRIVTVFGVFLLAFFFVIWAFSSRITKPLRQLTLAAEQVDKGKYDFKLDYNGNDEVGILTRTFKRVTGHLEDQISDLNDLAYADSLTSLHNKGAFEISLRELEAQVQASRNTLEFAICIFDCNRLKLINDRHGHEKGDMYLKETASVICEIFDHSPVFRIGGDEFAAILTGRDYMNRQELLRQFDEKCALRQMNETELWRQVDVARGYAVFDPKEDKGVDDVLRRADKRMYENKWTRKRQLNGEEV